jgi:hypothetical protein
MIRFLFGALVGATGYWAYKQGMLPFGTPQTFDEALPDSMSPIIRPTPHEVSSRPSEPIPS